jgi:hypothetical protein
MQKIIDLRQREEKPPENEEVSPAADQNSGFKPMIISWRGLLYYHNPNMKAVWIASSFFVVLAIILQIFQKNSITTVLMALIGLMILFQAKRKHNNTGEIAISPLGVKIGDLNYTFSEIKSFWVDYQPDYGMEELSIQLKKWYMPYIRIPIEDQSPVRIRDFLIQFIPEVHHETTLGEAIARRLGL